MHFNLNLFATDWPKRFAKLTPDRKCSSEENKWKEKAIESMIKKLKNQSDTLAALEKVLKKQSASTPCVTIAKTQDGRIQINQKKIFPHVAYCRLWRWPNLNNHNELKPVAGGHCSKSFYHSKLSEVCINPFHYERVQASLCAASPSQLDHHSLSNASFATCNDQYPDQYSMDLSIGDLSLNDQQFALYSNEHSPSDQMLYHSSNDHSPGHPSYNSPYSGDQSPRNHQLTYSNEHSPNNQLTYSNDYSNDHSPNYNPPAYHSNEHSPNNQITYHSNEHSPGNQMTYHSNENSPNGHQNAYQCQPFSEQPSNYSQTSNYPQSSNYCPVESPTFGVPVYDPHCTNTANCLVNTFDNSLMSK